MFAPQVTGTILLTSGELVIRRDLTIQAPGASVLAVSGSGQSRIFHTGTPPGSPATSFPDARVTISGLTIRDGNAPDDGDPYGGVHGGGFFVESGALTLDACVVSDCRAVSLVGRNGLGGGLCVRSGCILTMTGCTVTRNFVAAGYGYGGGVDVDGKATITNCTFTENSAFAGAGIACIDGTLTLTSCTLTRNTVVDLSADDRGFGGGVYLSAAVGAFTACLIAGNFLGAGDNPPLISGRDTYGPYRSEVTSGGSNLIGDNSFFGITNGVNHDQAGTSAAPIAAHLGPLQDNGGPTPTVAVLAGSPAIGGDYANSTLADQRNVARTASQHTIGAFEYQPLPSHTFLLWANTSGTAAIWNLGGPNPAATATLAGPYPGWTPRVIAQGPDGHVRLLWTNTNGQAALWNLNAPNPAATAFVAGPYSGWTATALAIGPDNAAHLLWDNTDGRVALWNATDANPSATCTIAGPYAGWAGVAIGIGSNGQERLLWDNTSGQASVWNLADAKPAATCVVDGPFTGWTAKTISVGDDNAAHLLWDNVSGQVSLWNLSDPNPAATCVLAGPYSGWSGQDLSVGADNKGRLLWDNGSGQNSLWNLSDASPAATCVLAGPYSGWTAVSVAAAR